MFMWWIPIKWAIEVLNTAKREKFITNAPGFSHLLGRLSDFRKGLTEVASYGYLPVPLVYTQVVHLAVYVFFAVSLIGEQWIIWKQEGDEEVDLYYPVFMTVRWGSSQSGEIQLCPAPESPVLSIYQAHQSFY